ncbi:MAG: hypothetical protein HQL86_09180, partial [Magnetococcales bacterium]|nr:hypothetical protein [Magnetococcales bacterium]
LMMRALTSTVTSGGLVGANNVAATYGNNGSVATSQSNMWGIGGGLAINAGAWTIKPSLDYARLVEENVNVTTPDVVVNAVAPSYTSAWGGTLGFSTKIQEATTLDLSGTMVKPHARVGGISEDSMHYVQASVKMDF